MVSNEVMLQLSEIIVSLKSKLCNADVTFNGQSVIWCVRGGAVIMELGRSKEMCTITLLTGISEREVKGRVQGG